MSARRHVVVDVVIVVGLGLIIVWVIGAVDSSVTIGGLILIVTYGLVCWLLGAIPLFGGSSRWSSSG